MNHAHDHAGHAAHNHAHGHSQTHGHAHGRGIGDPQAARASLTRALVLTVIVAVAEVLGGLATNSLALLADAGHMITDVAALALALFAGWLGARPRVPGQTFGPRRWEILAAWVNGAALVGISGVILWEAVLRLTSPQAVEGGLMLAVAIVGFLTNSLSAWWLHGVSSTSLNARGAYLHVLGDLGGSLATIIAAICVVWMGWSIADPLASIAVSILVLIAAWRLVREATDVLLEATPPHIDLGRVRTTLEELPSVESVHDLHVWTVGGGLVAMSAHAVLANGDAGQDVLEQSRTAMGALGIAHVTIQLEKPALDGCEGCE